MEAHELNISLGEELTTIKACLKEAMEWGLEVEAVAWALISLKDNPELSISEAMMLGVTEWIK